MPLSFQNFLIATLRLKCPLCLEGPVFQGWVNALRQCDKCGYFYSRESGYFAGSIYFGYAVSVLLAMIIGVVMGIVFGMGWSPVVLGTILIVVPVFGLWFFRYARILWMCLDLYLNPPVREDFQARGR
jgi:uncharacterized protein (DUF983 family)